MSARYGRLRGQDRPGRTAMAAAGVAVATGLSVAWLGLRIGGSWPTRIVDDGATALAALIATVSCVLAARRSAQLRRFWALLSAACGSWAIAEVIWAWYDLVLRVPVPVPSWADVGYLAAIPLALAALLAHPSLRVGRTRQARSLFDGLIVASALAFLSWTFVVSPVWHSTDLSTAGGLVALAYPFGDVMIVFFIVLAARRMTGSHRSIWFLLAGLLLMALSDSVYSYLSATNAYAPGDLIDVGWIAAYLTIGLSAVASDGRELVGTRAPAEHGRTIVSFLAPVVPALIALAVIGLRLHPEAHLGVASRVMASALVTLVIARQGLFMVELLTASTETAEVQWFKALLRTALGPKHVAGPEDGFGRPRA